ARRRTLSASSTGPSGCLSAGAKQRPAGAPHSPPPPFPPPPPSPPPPPRHPRPPLGVKGGGGPRPPRPPGRPPPPAPPPPDRLPGQQAQSSAKPPGDHLHTDRNGPDETGGDGEARKPHGGNAPLSQLCLPHAAEGGFSVEVEPVGERQFRRHGQEQDRVLLE